MSATIPLHTLYQLHAQAGMLVQAIYEACVANDITGFVPELDPALQAAAQSSAKLWETIKVHPEYIAAIATARREEV